MKLEVQKIKKSFGKKEVLKGISFSVESGQALGLLGRNGAGKTTTIRILMNVFPMDEGSVCIDGKDISECNIKIGYLPEERGLYPKKTIRDQLLYFAQLKGLRKKEGMVAIEKWLKRLEMEEYLDKKLETLSKGNQQKIQLITALLCDPDLIILDEPFSGLDPVNAQLLKDVVKEEIASGKLVIFSSHQMNYIEEFCDQIAILNQGEIAVQGSLKEIRHSYRRDKLVVRSEKADRIAQEYANRCKVNPKDSNELILFLEDETKKNAVMCHLTQKYEIDELRIYEPTLNDIFVEHTKDMEGEEA